LDPQIRKEAWTAEGERVIANAHRVYGNKWAEIAKLHGRYSESLFVKTLICYFGFRHTVFLSYLKELCLVSLSKT
jgi:hypothetical protein